MRSAARMRVTLQVAFSLGALPSVRGLPRLGVDDGSTVGSQLYDEVKSGLVGVGERLGLLDETGGVLVGGVVGQDRGSAFPPDDVEERFMDQRLDHFDRQESRTFRQRYFVTKKYWAGPDSGAPVFVCVGGEGPALSSDVLAESVHCNDMIELAPRHEALLLAIEHRYYGQSNPGDDWATESLQWLSSQQALADLSSFHGYISEKEGLTGGEKWVTWGGSYPGMLAGWARLKYPHLFHAAVSSSSPLQAQLDFPEYAEVMRQSLAAEEDGVGGSEACASAVETGHAVIGDLLATEEGRRELVIVFNLCDASSLEDENARISFAGDGVVLLPIQENDPACSGAVCNINAVCEIMTDDERGSEVDRLATIRNIQRNSSGQDDDQPCEVFPPIDDSSVKGLRWPLVLTREMRSRGAARGSCAADPSDPNRAWLYQTCTEFGFYQTCEVGTRCPFTQGLHTLELDLQLCQEAFGITPDQVGEQVRLTNLFYGGDQPRGSRVIFPNGAIDPWHALGVLETPAPGLPAIYVEGASHHFWTHPSKPTDSGNIVRAREIIWHQITSWLEEEDD